MSFVWVRTASDRGLWRPFPRMPDMPPSMRVESTAGVFWAAVLAFLIDNAVMWYRLRLC